MKYTKTNIKQLERILFMYFEWEYEVTPEVSRLVTEMLLDLYDEYKDDERIFSKEKDQDK
ncbi:hypothetical protein KU40_14835 [Clostridium botulinum]|nr:hypothetical protein KU40_14835 [Clostridium botulinum]